MLVFLYFSQNSYSTEKLATDSFICMSFEKSKKHKFLSEDHKKHKFCLKIAKNMPISSYDCEKCANFIERSWKMCKFRPKVAKNRNLLLQNKIFTVSKSSFCCFKNGYIAPKLEFCFFKIVPKWLLSLSSLGFSSWSI